MVDILKRLNAIRPMSAAVWTTLIAIALLFLSWWPFGLFTCASPPLEQPGIHKEVGFASALNWTLGYIVFAPFAFYFMLSALQCVSRTLYELSERRMLLDAEFRPISKCNNALITRWSLDITKACRWVLVLAVIGLVECLVEWWRYSGSPLLIGGLPAENENDWSVKFAGSHFSIFSHVGNGVFSLVVFLILQWPMIVAIAGFLIFTYCFCNFISGLSDRMFAYTLVPDIRSDNPRRGFEVFEEIAQNMLYSAAFCYAVFYLSRLWNAFLHSHSESTNLYDFVIGDLIKGFTAAGVKEGFGTLSRDLFALEGLDFSGTWVTFAALVLLTFSFAVLSFVLRMAAQRAKANLLRFLGEKPPDFLWQGKTPNECSEQLKTMSFWPINYPKPNELLLLGIFAICSLVFVRVGLFYIGVLMFVAAKKMWTMLRTTGGS